MLHMSWVSGETFVIAFNRPLWGLRLWMGCFSYWSSVKERMWWWCPCRWPLSSSSCPRWTWWNSRDSCSPSPSWAWGGHGGTWHQWRRRRRGSGSTSGKPRTGRHRWRRGKCSGSCSLRFFVVLWRPCSGAGAGCRASGRPGRLPPRRGSPWWPCCVRSREPGTGFGQSCCNRCSWPGAGEQKPKRSGWPLFWRGACQSSCCKACRCC